MDVADFARGMSDAELIDVVQAMDHLAKPMSRRFEGDDTALVNMMQKVGLPQDVVSKALVTSVVMRECLSRGVQIPHGN